MKSDIPICTTCKIRTQKDVDEFVCPGCGAVYNPDREIVEYEDTFTSSHADEMPEIGGTSGGGPGLAAADDEQDAPLTDMLYKSAKHKPNDGGYSERWD